MDDAASRVTVTLPSVDSRSGFCTDTATFYSLRPSLILPPLDQPLSVASFSFSHVSSSGGFPDRPAYIDAATGAGISYFEAAAHVRSIATALRPLVSKGDVAFVLSPASTQVPLLYMALFSVGAVVCPSNPACTPTEISRQLRLVKPKIAFATSSTVSLIPRSGPGTPDVVMLLDSPQFPSSSERCTGQHLLPLDLVEVRQSDAAVILFSSGTTGMPKAVLESHRAYIAMIAELADRRHRGLLPDDGPFLLAAPMFHSLGILFSMKGVALGETTIVMDRPPLRQMLVAAQRYQATSLTAAPPVVVRMAAIAVDKISECQAVDLRALRQIMSGGAPLQPAAIERFRRRFPWVDIMQGYGMTEGGGISMMVTSKECLNYRSVGRLNSALKARIVDSDTGRPLGVGMLGELRVKGSSVMTEYIEDYEATHSIFDSEGWLKTGDLCYFDENGYLYFVSRLKELIKYNGYQVPPTELEQLLVTHGEIIDAAVVPYPDDVAGEKPMAFVVRLPGSAITESQIMDFIAKQVAPYKKIRKVSFIDSIPKNPSGKILRKKLVSYVIPNRQAKL